ncbi:MAG: cyclic nucleotide-binding domain-containing protein, partial [Actinobacteria bacterium]|nr:cyclic nucleotide-binding domain-containing protein [Actinomycetota bacterium]
MSGDTSGGRTLGSVLFEEVADDLRSSTFVGSPWLQLAARATPTEIPAGRWLFRRGDAGDSMYVVLSGRLEVVTEEPEVAVIRVLGRGDAVGELALLTGSPRSASVKARRDT